MARLRGKLVLRGGTDVDLLRGSFGADLCRCGDRTCDETCEPMGRAARALFGANVRIVDWPCNRRSDFGVGLRAICPLAACRT